MKIKLMTQYAGPLGTFPPGSDPAISDLDKIEIVDGGYAILIDPPQAPIEIAVVSPPENAAIMTGKRGKK